MVWARQFSNDKPRDTWRVHDKIMSLVWWISQLKFKRHLSVNKLFLDMWNVWWVEWYRTKLEAVISLVLIKPHPTQATACTHECLSDLRCGHGMGGNNSRRQKIGAHDSRVTWPGFRIWRSWTKTGSCWNRQATNKMWINCERKWSVVTSIWYWPQEIY
mgnify:CR=1 FL=1